MPWSGIFCFVLLFYFFYYVVSNVPIYNLNIFYDGEIHIHTYIQTDRDRQTDRHAYVHTYIHTYVRTYIHTHAFFLIEFHSMQGWTAVMRHGVTRKRNKKG